MKLAFCNEPFQGFSLEATLDVLAEAGYDAVELAPFTLAEDATQLSTQARRSIRLAARERGLDVAGLHWLLVKPAGLHLTTPDDQVRKRTVEFIEGLIRLCSELEGKVLVWGSPKQRSFAPDQDQIQVRKMVVETLVRLAESASRNGVTFCIEPLSRDQTNFINRPDEAAELIKEAGSPPGLALILDTYSSNLEGIDIVEALRRHFELVRHIHLNDTNQLGPGMGTCDFAPLLQAARSLGYTGYLSVEPFDYTPGPKIIARASRTYLSSLGL